MLAQTTPAARLREGVPPRHWKYSAAITIAPTTLARLGAQSALDAIVAFADAVDVKTGIVFWAESFSYAGALAMGAGGGLTPEQESRVADSLYYRTHWGRIVRGPEWGTFVSAAHVAALGGSTVLAAQAEKVVPLRLGGAFVQLTTVDEAPPIDAPSARLDALRSALAPVLPDHPSAPT